MNSAMDLGFNIIGFSRYFFVIFVYKPIPFLHLLGIPGAIRLRLLVSTEAAIFSEDPLGRRRFFQLILSYNLPNWRCPLLPPVADMQ